MNKSLTILMLAAVAWATLGLSQQARGDIQQNLDRPVSLPKQELLIDEVFKKLSAQSGVEIVVHNDTYACLTYGKKTRLAVYLKDVTLRDALTQMLSPMALSWTVEDDVVRITPSEGLFRMGRGATYDELQVMGRIYTATLKPDKNSDQTLAQLRKLTRNDNLDLAFEAENLKPEAAFAKAQGVLPNTIANWLDAVAGSSNTWYLNGDEIIILPKKKQVERQLQRVVSLRYQHQQMGAVLMDLAKQARVQLVMEPGVLASLPAEVRTDFTLLLADTTIAQALEWISGNTGLQFTRTDEGLAVEMGKTPTTFAAPRRGSGFVTYEKTLADGTKVNVYIRIDDLPEDLRKAIETDKGETIKKLRKAYNLAETPATEEAVD